MIDWELFIRVLVGAFFLYLGISAFIKGEVSGVANKIPGVGKGIYNGGKPYYHIKGKAAYIIGALCLWFGLSLLLIF